jgi:cob(I)alamin adenosyltransferase
VTLSRQEEVSETGGRYLNRLSDLLFVMARFLNRQQDIEDVYWQREAGD